MKKWSELSVEGSNELVARRIFGWEPGPCDGEMGEQPWSPDGWFCMKCGYEGSWGDSFEHTEIAPRYTESLDKAWEIIRKMEAGGERDRVHGAFAYYLGVRFVDFRDPFTYAFWINLKQLADLKPDAIAYAALKALGEEIEW